MIGRRRRRGAVLVLVLAAILLLSVTVTLIARRAILTRRAIDSAAAVAQAESVWMTAAEVFRQSGSASELQFSLPDSGAPTRTAVARVRARDDGGWEIEASVEQNGRVIARRRGTISVPQAAQPASTAAASQESEGKLQ